MIVVDSYETALLFALSANQQIQSTFVVFLFVILRMEKVDCQCGQLRMDQ
jgi:hypothetical protein